MDPEGTRASEGKRSRAWLFAATGAGAVVLGVAVWLLVHGFGWIKYRRVVAELRARGEVLDVEALALPPVPDEENAAIVLRPVLERARGCEDQMYDDPELRDWGAWASFRKELGENRHKLQEALSKHQDVFELAAGALKRPRCRFVDYSALPPETPHLLGLKSLARLFRVKLRLEVEESPGKAAETLEHLLAISETLSEEPLDMSQMTRGALFDFFVDSLRHIETKEVPLTAERRKGLIQRLEQAKFEESYLHTLMIERARIVGTSFVDDAKACALWMDIRPPILPGTVLTLRARLLSELTRMIDAARDSHAEFAAMALRESARKRPKDDIAGFELQGLYKVYLLCLMCAARRDLARLALALGLYRSEHGRYPETLDGLAVYFPDGVPPDPFTGDSLVYQRTEEGFLLYSLGPDKKDGGGTPGKRPLWPFEGDICWKHPAELGPPAETDMSEADRRFREFLKTLHRVERSTRKRRFWEKVINGYIKYLLRRKG